MEYKKSSWFDINNQTALEEQRRKQKEKSEEPNSLGDTEKQVLPQPAQSLSFKLPCTSIQQSNEAVASTTNDKKQSSNLSWSQLSSVTQTENSSNVSTEDLLSHAESEYQRLTHSIETSSSHDTSTLANHITTRKDTATFVAAHGKADVDSKRQQTKLESDHRNQSAYKQIISHAKNLLQSGNESQARELLRQVKEQPHSLYALAEQSRAESLSPQHLRMNIESSLRLGNTEKPEEMQATQYSQMSREEQQNHTLELMSGLTSQLDESSQSFIANEEAIASLANPKQRDSQRTISNPFGLSLGQTRNPFDAIVSDNKGTSLNSQIGVIDEASSMLQRLGINPSQDQIDNRISNREQYREALIKDRKNLLSAYGYMIKLAQAGKADQIHLLFDGKGNPLGRKVIADRASYNSGLSDEVEGQYRDLYQFLHRDDNFEAGVSCLSDSLLGLSHEEQVVRARILITEQLQISREALDLIRSTDHGIGQAILANKDTPALERLAAVDQGIIGNMTRETLARRANTLFDSHDQLTDSLNSKDFEAGQKVIEDLQAHVENGSYLYGRDKHTERELVNRDLARTPEETQQIEKRIADLESEIKDTQIESIKSNQRNISSDLDEIKSFTGLKPLGLFDSRTWRDISGEDDVLFNRIDSTLKHSGEILDNLLDQQSDIKTARERMYCSNQLERYEKELASILGKTHEKYQSASQQLQRDLSRISADLRGIDNFHAKTEARLEYFRQSAIIMAVTLATGSTGTGLIASRVGLAGAKFSVGTAAGTGIGLISNTAEGIGRHGYGFENPYANIGSKTLRDFKDSATTSACLLFMNTVKTGSLKSKDLKDIKVKDFAETFKTFFIGRTEKYFANPDIGTIGISDGQRTK
jgi:hypothetical protein